MTAPSPSYTGSALPNEPSQKNKQKHSLPAFGRFKTQSLIIQLSKTAEGALVSHQFSLLPEHGFQFWSSISAHPGLSVPGCSEQPPGEGVMPSRTWRQRLPGTFAGPLDFFEEAVPAAGVGQELAAWP